MATYRRTISTNPRRGDLSPKKATDQRTLRINWTKKKIKAVLNRGWSCLLQTMNRDIPMSINRLIQTGLNIQLGGVKKGFLNVLYQVGMAGMVKREPRKPASWQRTILITSLRISLIFTFSFLTRKPHCSSIPCSIDLMSRGYKHSYYGRQPCHWKKSSYYTQIRKFRPFLLRKRSINNGSCPLITPTFFTQARDALFDGVELDFNPGGSPGKIKIQSTQVKRAIIDNERKSTFLLILSVQILSSQLGVAGFTKKSGQEVRIAVIDLLFSYYWKCFGMIFNYSIGVPEFHP